jgi:hypothetical protein
MPRHPRAAIPAAPRMTLLQWIEHDDGNTIASTQPACKTQVQDFHARIALAPQDGRRDAAEPLAPPPGLALAPLG